MCQAEGFLLCKNRLEARGQIPQDDTAAPSFYTQDVIRYLHTLSAILFYILGASAFLAYLLWANAIAAKQSLLWLQSIDLPLEVVALLFGGLSVYQSMTPAQPSRALALWIAIPLVLVFFLSLFLKFW